MHTTNIHSLSVLLKKNKLEKMINLTARHSLLYFVTRLLGSSVCRPGCESRRDPAP